MKAADRDAAIKAFDSFIRRFKRHAPNWARQEDLALLSTIRQMLPPLSERRATNMETARACWGETIPTWVEHLARLCDASSQNKVAIKIGRSTAYVNQVLRNRYKGDTQAVEKLLRVHFSEERIDCPAHYAPILPSYCLHWQMRANRGYLGSGNFMNQNARDICPDCPNNLKNLRRAGLPSYGELVKRRRMS